MWLQCLSQLRQVERPSPKRCEVTQASAIAGVGGNMNPLAGY